MGWLIRNDPLPYGTTPDSYLRETFNHESDRARLEVLASSFVGTTWYAAVRYTAKAEPAEGWADPEKYDVPLRAEKTIVTALVVLTRGGTQRFGYKDMDECMGPVERECPLYILDMLSPVKDLAYGPTSEGWASEWRVDCRANALKRRQRQAKARAFVPGTRVKLDRAYSFGGVEIQDFKVIPRPNRTKGVIAVRDDGKQGGLYRLSARILELAEVVS